MLMCIIIVLLLLLLIDGGRLPRKCDRLNDFLNPEVSPAVERFEELLTSKITSYEK